MDFEKLKSFRNINNNFAKLLGIELTELSDGSLIVCLHK